MDNEYKMQQFTKKKDELHLQGMHIYRENNYWSIFMDHYSIVHGAFLSHLNIVLLHGLWKTLCESHHYYAHNDKENPMCLWFIGICESLRIFSWGDERKWDDFESKPMVWMSTTIEPNTMPINYKYKPSVFPLGCF